MTQMEATMTTGTTEKRAPVTSGDDVVPMYPDNQLKEQVREFGKGHRASTVLKAAFFSNK